MLDRLRSLPYRLGLRHDRRQSFNDLSKLPPNERRPQSEVIQFYSSFGNIGNYTPVLGIHDMLGVAPDLWCVHNRPVDFSYINRNYKAVVVGGAGLLYRVFSPFWEELRDECRLPTVLWGLGGCFPRAECEPNVDATLVRAVYERSELCNVRDTITAEYYGMNDASITLCPTVVWLERYRPCVKKHARGILFASHDGVVPGEEVAGICEAIRQSGRRSRVTLNIQRRSFGLVDMIKKLYCRSRVVVATRLHGAIIAYGLGIPYLALVWDDKVTAFDREWGTGSVVGGLTELTDCLKKPLPPHTTIPPQAMESVRYFGDQVVSRFRELGVEGL